MLQRDTEANRSLTGRVPALDGLRGVAATIVVIFHFLAAFHQQIVPDRTDNPAWIADTPLNLFWNGPFSVVVFFVLSGFVISGSAIKRKQMLPAALIFRYLRLALPATASVIFAWSLLSLLPSAADVLNTRHPSSWLSGSYQFPIPDFSHAIFDGSIGIFERGWSRFNNALWTMKIELLGSATVYCIFYLNSRTVRILVLLLASVALPLMHRTLYEGFMFGALLFEAAAAGFLPTKWPVCAFLLGSLIGAAGTGFAFRMGLSPLPMIFWPGNSNGLLYPIAATLIVYGCLRSAAIGQAFRQRVPQFLGRISFSLYLIHVPMLYTIFAWLRMALPDNHYTIGIVAMIFFPTCIAVGYAGAVFVDENVLNFLGFARRRIDRRRRMATPVA